MEGVCELQTARIVQITFIISRYVIIHLFVKSAFPPLHFIPIHHFCFCFVFRMTCTRLSLVWLPPPLPRPFQPLFSISIRQGFLFHSVCPSPTPSIRSNEVKIKTSPPFCVYSPPPPSLAFFESIKFLYIACNSCPDLHFFFLK